MLCEWHSWGHDHSFSLKVWRGDTCVATWEFGLHVRVLDKSSCWAMSIYSDLTICCEIFGAAVSLLGVEQLFSVTAGCESFSSLIFYTLRTFHWSKLLLKRLLSSHNIIWCRERFIEYWVDQNMLIADTATRVFTVLKQPDKNYLTQVSFHTLQDVMWWTLTPSPGGFQASVHRILRGFSGSFEKVQMLNIVGIWHWWVMQEDFRPILRELLATHRGLEFLHDTPEFQERYGTDKATSFDRLCVGYELMNCVLGSYWPEEVHGL
jgi:hypothetical protein